MSDRTRGNGLKPQEERFRLDVSKKFSAQSVVRHWHKLLRDVDAWNTSLEVFKATLNGALSNLV